MKAQHATHNRRRQCVGSALLMTVILALALGLVLGSYLYLTGTQTNLVAESQAWNAALAYAEAGIEEGMAQINVNVGKFGIFGTGTQAVTNYSVSIMSNFGSPANGVYGPVTRQLGGGSYTLSISNDFPPTIYATGSNLVASIGRPITRTVQVKTSIKPLFGDALAAILGLSANGNNVNIDAYDSSNPAHSTNGLYYAPTALATADVASPGTGIIGVGNANIHGHLLLSPNAGYSIGSQGLVGDMPANWPAQSGVEPGWVISDFNQDFPDVTAPYTSGVAPVYSNGATNYTLGSFDYYVSGDFSMGKNDVMLVNGNARLYATGNVNLTTVYIPSGASLRVYVGSASGSAVAGSFQNANLTGATVNAMNFQVYGLPTMTGLTFSGNGTFLGTFYAPEAILTLNGGGSNPSDYEGACVVQSITLNGHFNLHFDQNLKRNGPSSGFTLANWTEL